MYMVVWMKMHLTIIQKQMFKQLISMETYNVFMHHVMTFQNMDVFMQMDLEHLLKVLALQNVHNMEGHHVKK